MGEARRAGGGMARAVGFDPIVRIGRFHHTLQIGPLSNSPDSTFPAVAPAPGARPDAASPGSPDAESPGPARLSPVQVIVLGLLRLGGSATPYDLKQRVSGSVGNFWS